MLQTTDVHQLLCIYKKINIAVSADDLHRLSIQMEAHDVSSATGELARLA